jgi:uncharacterized protein
MNKQIVALLLSGSRFLVLKRVKAPFTDHWELPSVSILGDGSEREALQDSIKTTLNIDIFPYLKLERFNKNYRPIPISIYRCSIISKIADVSPNSNYSGHLWTYILNTKHLTFAPPHDAIIKFLMKDKYLISYKTMGRPAHFKSNTTKGSGISKRGFASMDPETRSMIAGLGGKAAHASGMAHKFTSEEARRAGTIGGRRKHALALDRV